MVILQLTTFNLDDGDPKTNNFQLYDSDLTIN